MLIVGFTVATSLIGLVTEVPYAQETADWATQARGQDVGNLVAATALAVAAVGAWRGSLRARQVWAGCLLYLVYAFAVYAVAVHFGPLFLPYVAVLGLSAYALLFGLVPAPGAVLVASGARGWGAWTLIAVAVLFTLLWLSEIVPALTRGVMPAGLVSAGLASNPVWVLDLALVLPGMAITGLGALRQRPASLLLLAPWLTFTALMGASIVAALLLAAVAAGPALVPLVMVGLVTLASTGALVAVLSATRDATPGRASGSRTPPAAAPIHR